MHADVHLTMAFAYVGNGNLANKFTSFFARTGPPSQVGRTS
jgi:hypothetical protein